MGVGGSSFFWHDPPMADPFDAHAFPDRLNLGCGWDIREGFLNVDLHDFHKPQLVADVTDLSMLPSEHYVEIVAQDVLEHLPRQSTVSVLAEWSRLLRTGGTLELRVPSVLGIARLLQTPEYQTIPQQELMVQCLFGTQAYTEDCHYTTFTEPLLRHYLAQAGLEPIVFSLRDEWLFEVVARKTEQLGGAEVDPFSDGHAVPNDAPEQPLTSQAPVKPEGAAAGAPSADEPTLAIRVRRALKRGRTRSVRQR